MSKEFVIKNGVIVNNTHSITGITNDSGLTLNDSRLVSEKAIKEYVDNNEYWELSGSSLSIKDQSNNLYLYNLSGNSQTHNLFLDIDGKVIADDSIRINDETIDTGYNLLFNAGGNKSFQKILYYDNSSTSYTDYTITLGGNYDTTVEILNENTDYLYLGNTIKFNEILFGSINTAASGITLIAEYWNGTTWSSLTITEDGTENLTIKERNEQNNDLPVIYYNTPNDWTENSVSGFSYYWVRLSTSTVPVTAPKPSLISIGDNRPIAIKANKYDTRSAIRTDDKGFMEIENLLRFYSSSWSIIEFYTSPFFKIKNSNITTRTFSFQWEDPNGIYDTRTNILFEYDYCNFNNNRYDVDFIIRKNIIGDAYKYDAGTDEHRWDGKSIFNYTNTDFDFIIRKNNSGEAVVYNAGLDEISINSPLYLSSGTSIYNISIDSGMTGDDDSIWTTKAIQEYVNENNYTKVESDSIFVHVTGDTMTGPLNITDTTTSTSTTTGALTVAGGVGIGENLNIGGTLSLSSGTSIYNISIDSGMTGDDDSIWTTKAIKEYVDSGSVSTIESDSTQIIFNSGGTLTGSSNLTYTNGDLVVGGGAEFSNNISVGNNINLSQKINFSGYTNVTSTNGDLWYSSTGLTFYDGNNNIPVGVEYFEPTGSGDLSSFESYCERQYKKGQPAYLYSSDGVYFDFQNLSNSQSQYYNLVPWYGIAGGGVSGWGNNPVVKISGILENHTGVVGISLNILDDFQIYGYGRASYHFHEVWSNIVGTIDLTLQVVDVRIDSLRENTGDLRIFINQRSSLNLGYSTGGGKSPDIYLSAIGSTFKANLFDGDGDIYVGYDGITTYNECNLELGYFSNGTIYVYGNRSRILVSNANINIQSGSSQNLIIGCNNTIIDNGSYNSLLSYNTIIGNTLKVNGNSGSTSINSGALIVNGGVGIGENLNIGGTLSLSSGTSIYNISTDSGLTVDNDSIWTTKAIQEYVLENSSTGGTEIQSDPTQIIFNSGGTLIGSNDLTYNNLELITNGLKISGNTLNITESRTITNSDDSGEKGEICWDENYIYICINTNEWKRTSIADW